MRILNAQQMAALDKKVATELGLPTIVLMENAARGVAQAINERFSMNKFRHVVILCGRGNNGGDGLALARFLLGQGRKVRVLLLDDPDKLTGDAATNYQITRSMLPADDLILASKDNDLGMASVIFSQADLIVDALLGTGAKGGLSGHYAHIIDLLPVTMPVVAVDLPSGLSADEGKTGRCVKADLTVTICLPKRGLFHHTALESVGELTLVGFGVPARMADELATGTDWRYFDAVEARASSIPVDKTAAKGRFGRLLIIGGSRGLEGAVALTARGALRAGIGTVTVATDQAAEAGLRPLLLEAMTMSLPSSSSCLGPECIKPLLSALENVDALVIGPGMGRAESSKSFLRDFWKELEQRKIPVVLDADGINNSTVEELAKLDIAMILTPHAGELARFAGLEISEVEHDRFASASNLAKCIGKVVALKGHGTVVADAKGGGYVCHPGCVALATGGAGDVLAGIMGALLAHAHANQVQMPLEILAARAISIHSLAGMRAATLIGSRGVLAHEIADCIPYVMDSLEEFLPDPTQEVCYLPI